MNSIMDDFKNVFRKRDNALMQIIVINLIAAVVSVVFYVTLTVFIPMPATWHFIKSQLLLSSDWQTFIVRPWTFFTYAFFHVSPFHILFNMLFLYWFGKLIEEYLGTKRVISLYVLGALTGAVLFVLLMNFVPYFYHTKIEHLLVGASAGVYAIVVAAATLLPNYTFHLLFFGPVKIKYIALVGIILSFLGIAGANAGGDIAHMGGAIMGYVFVAQLNRGRDLGRWINVILDKIASLFRPKPKMKTTYRSKTKVAVNRSYRTNVNNKSTQPGTPDQSEIDAILDKISESGYESLSKEEKQKLFQASQN